MAELDPACSPAAVPHETKEALQTRIYFHASHDSVQYGETVRVVGNHPSLGAWDPKNGVRLKTFEDVFPCWVSEEPVSVELHAEIEYKYVVVGEDGTLRAWEDYSGNRKFVASGLEMTIEDDEGQYRTMKGTLGSQDELDEVHASSKTRAPTVNKMDKEQRLAFVQELEGSVTIEQNDTIYMVALQLPLKVERGDDGNWIVQDKAPSDGRNFATLPAIKELRENRQWRVMCVGWPGVHVENLSEQRLLERKLLEYDCIPVFPPKQAFEQFVTFYTSFLWPIFHDVMLDFQTTINPRPFSEQGWASYQRINNVYAQAVVRASHENDLIMLHDYHLLMVPSFISRRMHKANIFLYLHTPFPSSDSFRSLPVREEILSGMLCADLLGFQFFTYARSFLVSCKRIFGLDPTFRAGGFMGLDYNGRLVMIKVGHFVYPYKDTQTTVDSDIVTEKAAEIKQLFVGKTVFTSMDRCDGLSGLIPKFQAFKRFLREFPKFRGKVVLVQYCFEMGAGGYERSSDLLESLKEWADAFLQVEKDGKLGIVVKEKPQGAGADEETLDIYLRIEGVAHTDRLALFRASDVLLDTCVKAGLNLMPFEFITAHHDDNERHSVVIVSEFSGCSRVLLGCLRINPWNTSELVGTCEKALTMVQSEKKERLKSNLLYVSASSPVEWFEEFLSDLRRARKKDTMRIVGFGFGAQYRHLCVGQDFRKLPNDVVLNAYRTTKNRFIFLDNEGTLSADKRSLHREYGAPKGDVSDLKSHGSAPDEQVMKCLEALSRDRRNTVVILSGRPREMMEEWFTSIPNIGLAAERGFYYKLPMATNNQWHCMLQNPDYSWKTYCFEIMRQYVKRTQGSFVENKGSALVWQYRDADQHFGSWQAKELSSNLKELLFGFDIEVIEGKGYVEVKLRGVNKGVAVTKVIRKVEAQRGEADFVLCIGDDRSDEDMFEVVNAFIDPSEEAHNDEGDSSQLSTTDADSHAGSESYSERDDRRGGLKAKSAGQAGLGSLGRASLSLGGGGSFAGNLCSMGESHDLGGEKRRFFTCTVGQKPSAAKFYLDEVEEVSELLSSLEQEHERRYKDDFQQNNANTWSGGSSSLKTAGRLWSMPTLSSLAFPVNSDPGIQSEPTGSLHH
jgi:trehalose 6-phosphate synthase/phosphatase